MRGGHTSNGDFAGIFYFNGSYSYINGISGFRVVLSVKE
jgi:hypothetical protein